MKKNPLLHVRSGKTVEIVQVTVRTTWKKVYLSVKVEHPFRSLSSIQHHFPFWDALSTSTEMQKQNFVKQWLFKGSSWDAKDWRRHLHHRLWHCLPLLIHDHLILIHNWHMTDTWQKHNWYTTDTWQTHNWHMTDMTDTRLIHDRHDWCMTDTWLTHDRHTTDTWQT